MKTYWITYTDGTWRTFEAPNSTQAYDFFKSEGDHAIDFGPFENVKSLGTTKKITEKSNAQ